MPNTCTIDVTNDNPDGVKLVDIATMLGVTSESLRQEGFSALDGEDGSPVKLVGNAARILREGLSEYEDHVPDDHMSAFARMQEER